MKNKNTNKILKAYKGQNIDSKRTEYYVSLAMKNLDTSKNNFYKIADLGSGYQLFIPFLTDNIKESDLYMVDDFKNLDKFFISNETIKEKKQRKKFLPNVNKLLKKLKIKKINLNFEKQKLTFKNNSLNLITSFHCIEHLHNSPKPFMKECYRVLKPDGALIIAVPNAVNLRKRISVFFGYTNYYILDHYWNHTRYYGHIREPIKNELKFFCSDSGFTDIKIYGKNFMGIERLKKILYKLIRNEKISEILASLLLKPLEIFPGLCTDLHVICKKPSSKL